MEGRPYRFANELVCGRLAQFLLLPMPPFGFTYFGGQRGVNLPKGLMFSELDFDYERRTPVMPEIAACIEFLPELCAGILLFDIFVANWDRHLGHLWCDSLLKPTRLMIYDHDLALFGSTTAHRGLKN